VVNAVEGTVDLIRRRKEARLHKYLLKREKANQGVRGHWEATKCYFSEIKSFIRHRRENMRDRSTVSLGKKGGSPSSAGRTLRHTDFKTKKKNEILVRL